ncbi:MAG TPA: polysaccharide deacetylase family protein [Pseudolabrys sp.]|jgi:peptidoglycan/xylan/chitin deacetylase (PgdA/CDA1 family)|nr:polysaccharide deacetylase family protein [Pseudolabrys sp.]
MTPLPDYPVPLAADEQPSTQQSQPVEVQPSSTATAKPADQTGSLPPAQQVAVTCPGNPDALGTSRVITIAPGEFSLLGTIQYKQTLPLNDHEVVLTFDDGPIPPYSNIILSALESQCVKATYFMVGEMAHSYPAIARRIYNAGMTIGTHSQDHPLGFQRLSMQRVEREVDGGIASVDAALGNEPNVTAPFFRIPGFGRNNAIEAFLKSKGLVTWSADIDTDDWWRGTSPGAVVQRAMRRLNAKGRGIILMHDIHPATALALPALLKALKAGGYHVVQVVAAGERPKSLPDLVATRAEQRGNWPRVLRVSDLKKTPAHAAGRHRIKKLMASRHHRVKTASAPEADGNYAVHAWENHGQF